MRVIFKGADEIKKLREVNLVVSQILDACVAAARPGVSTLELNEIAEREIARHKVISAFRGYASPPYPAVLCTSVNEVIVHGIPRKDVVLKDGDIIGIDFGCFKDGYCGDSARTIAIGKVTEDARKLMAATKESLEKAIEQCKP